MSEENKNLGDKAEDAFDAAKEKAKDMGEKAEETFDSAKESAKEFAEDTKEAASDFADEAKKTANEFTESAKEAFDNVGGENKKMLAGILAIVLGGFGIHKFILGYTKEGVIMLAVTIVIGALTCGLGASAVWVIGLVEGIMYLTKSDEEFYNTYQVGRKPWF
ncbi:NINE protein [Maribacter sp.]|uniref:NINE protein n=1 Tax=Maribacter sp. TaxID=1897614 RepID=UPI0025B92474|nr:NINE protein [Maribacter sp.]